MSYEPALEALADPTRRRILDLLRDGPRPVGELAERLPVSRPAVSRHLRVMADASLVRHEPHGTRHLYEVDLRGLAAIREWLDDWWDEPLRRFASHVEESRHDDV
jgi:DNA-binding transcriptional ArsR family regulator